MAGEDVVLLALLLLLLCNRTLMAGATHDTDAGRQGKMGANGFQTTEDGSDQRGLTKPSTIIDSDAGAENADGGTHQKPERTNSIPEPLYTDDVDLSPPELSVTGHPGRTEFVPIEPILASTAGEHNQTVNLNRSLVTISGVHMNDEETTGESLNGMDPSTYRLITNYIDTCYEDTFGHLVELCSSRTLTCKHNCGPSRKTDEARKRYCHCDSYCYIYDDCCRDFEQMCPKEVEKFHSMPQYDGMRGSCLDNYYHVIDTCRQSQDSGKTKYLNDAGASPVFDVYVTDISNGLQFVNYSIFSCNRFENSEPLFWQKRFLGSALNFTESGSLTDLIGPISDFETQHPDGFVPRFCYKKSGFFCRSPVRENCSRVSLSNVLDLCQVVHEVSPPVVRTSVSTTTLPPTSTTVSLSTQTDLDSSSALSRVSRDAESELPSNNSTPESFGQTCETTMKVDKEPKHDISLGSLMSFSKDGKVQLTQRDALPGRWSLIDCVSTTKASGPSVPWCLITKCGQGSILYRDRCYIPQKLTLAYQLRVTRYYDAQVFPLFIEQNIQGMSDILIVTNKSDRVYYSKSSNTVRFSQTFHNIDFISDKYSGAFTRNGLPHVKYFQHLAFRMQKKDLLSFPDNLSMCITMRSLEDSVVPSDVEKEDNVSEFCEEVFFYVPSEDQFRMFNHQFKPHISFSILSMYLALQCFLIFRPLQ